MKTETEHITAIVDMLRAIRKHRLSRSKKRGEIRPLKKSMLIKIMQPRLSFPITDEDFREAMRKVLVRKEYFQVERGHAILFCPDPSPIPKARRTRVDFSNHITT